MKINDQKTSIELNNYLKGVDGNVKRQAAQVKKAGDGGDKVEISVKSKDIQKARQIVDAVPEVRDDKVNEIKKSLESGTYTVKSGAIAENIIKKSLIDTVL